MGGLDLLDQFLATAGLMRIAGEQAEVSIFQLFAKLLPGSGDLGNECIQCIRIKLGTQLFQGVAKLMR